MNSKIRKHIKYLISCLALIFLFNYSFSATLQLQKIGTLDLDGRTYSEWWYTGTNPVFYGVAESGSKVDIKIGESTFSTDSDASGNWSYATQMDTGDHNIEISQGVEKISFILHAGQVFTGSAISETEESTSGVPETGFNQYVAMSFGVGIILLATYFYFSSDSKGKTVFENRMLKED